MQLIGLKNSQNTQKEVTKFLDEWNNSLSYIIQKTSGSTGTPKEIKIEKDMMLASAKTTNHFFNINKSSSLLLCISPEYIGGKMMIVRTLLADATLYLSDISGNPVQELNNAIDLAAMVPLQVEKSISNMQLLKIKNLIIGGAPVSDALNKSISNIQLNAYSTFGMTETVSHIALKHLKSNNNPFICLPPTTVSCNENDELVIHSPHLNIDKLTTNDIVELLNNYSFYWKGRSDFTINSGGIKFQPEEIEKKLVTLFNDQHFFISSLKDNLLGEKIVLCIEGENSSIKEIKLAMQQILGKYEQPKEIYVLTNFSYTKNGKLDRIKTNKRIRFEGISQ